VVLDEGTKSTTGGSVVETSKDGVDGTVHLPLGEVRCVQLVHQRAQRLRERRRDTEMSGRRAKSNSFKLLAGG
jgi:hypothetical protein